MYMLSLQAHLYALIHANISYHMHVIYPSAAVITRFKNTEIIFIYQVQLSLWYIEWRHWERVSVSLANIVIILYIFISKYLRI